MDELPAHAKAVLRYAQQHDQCHDDDVRRRVREGVARAVGAGGGGASVLDRPRVTAQPAVPPAVHGGSAPFFGLAGKLTASAVLVALVGTGIALRLRGAASHDSFGSRASAVVFAPAAGQGEPAAAAAKSARPEQAGDDQRPLDEPGSTPAPAELRARAGLLGSRLPARAPSRDTLGVEVALMRRLGEAVSRHDVPEAQRLLAQHRARFAQPALLEERQGFSALVRCMEQSPAALASSRAFVARYPNSVLTARVLHECEPAGR